MNIPVFHDDQHGTAIISGGRSHQCPGLVGKKIEEVRLVVNGAGAAAIACANLAVSLGLKQENMIMCDTKGVIYTGPHRGDEQVQGAVRRRYDLAHTGRGGRRSDVLFGLSSKGAFTPEMVRSMAANPIIFAMANPDPEITPEEAHAVRGDVLIATGRSDYPNQVNNVLGFPFIFRGALDVRATTINEEMKKAAVFALAELAREECPTRSVAPTATSSSASAGTTLSRNLSTPGRCCGSLRPLPRRRWTREWHGNRSSDMDKYVEQLESLQGKAKETLRMIINKAKSDPKSIVFPEGENEKILRAAQVLVEEGIARPILIGNETKIRATLQDLGIELNGGVTIIDPANYEKSEEYATGAVSSQTAQRTYPFRVPAH